MTDKVRTPEEYAEREVNKRIAKEIASRKLKVKEYRAKIKKLEKEINKIKNGELFPDED